MAIIPKQCRPIAYILINVIVLNNNHLEYALNLVKVIQNLTANSYHHSINILFLMPPLDHLQPHL